jgi:hypothetical protein
VRCMDMCRLVSAIEMYMWSAGPLLATLKNTPAAHLPSQNVHVFGPCLDICRDTGTKIIDGVNGLSRKLSEALAAAKRGLGF